MEHVYRCRPEMARAAASSGIALNGPVRPLALLAVVVGLLIPGATVSGQSLCAVSVGETPPFLPNPNKTHLTVEARAEYVPFTDTLQPYRYRPPRGQVVAVEALRGPGPSEFGPDSLAIIVQWGQGDELVGCHLAPTRDSLPAGSRYLLEVELRPDSLWLEGLPTFDLRPGLLSAYSRHGRTAEAPSFATFRALRSALPSREAWATDCRPGIAGVERWLDAHPQAGRYSPFNDVLDALEDYCLRSLEGHAKELERQEATQPVPDQVETLYDELGCRDDSTTLNSVEDAVDGRFVASEAPQWTFICPRGEDWQLLVAVLESPPRIIEILRMAGNASSWLVFAAAPDYFDWVCWWNVGAARYRGPHPQRDVVLLLELGYDDETLAFYETSGGWANARTRYCENRLKGALDVRQQQE